jgi:hypothetical protein
MGRPSHFLDSFPMTQAVCRRGTVIDHGSLMDRNVEFPDDEIYIHFIILARFK